MFSAEGGLPDRKLPKPRPNFFLAVRVHDERLVQQVKAVQDKLMALIGDNHQLKNCFINPSKLHITLFVLYIKSESDMNKSEGNIGI